MLMGKQWKLTGLNKITAATAIWHYYFYQRDEDDIDYRWWTKLFWLPFCLIHFINHSWICMPYFNHHVYSLFPLRAMLSYVSPCRHLFICLQSWNHWWWLFIIYKDKKVLFLWRRYSWRVKSCLKKYVLFGLLQNVTLSRIKITT